MPVQKTSRPKTKKTTGSTPKRSSAQPKKYQNYFQDHYQYSFSDQDLARYKQWFQAQWRVMQPFLPAGSKAKTQPVLEIGSAIGGFAQFLAEAGYSNVTGLELDAAASAFATKTFPHYTFHTKKLEEFAPKQKYNLACAFEVFEHLDNPRQALTHLHSLMEKNGRLIATSPFPFPKNIWGDKTHTYVLHPANWQKLLEEAGFSQVETQPMSFPPFLWRLHPSLNVRLPFYVGLPQTISTTLLVATA